MVSLFYTTFISVYLAHLMIFRAKVGKGGIIYPLDLLKWFKVYYWYIAPQMEHSFSFLKFYIKVTSHLKFACA